MKIPVNDRKTKFVVVMGHPRSGTGYMSKLFSAFGMDVKHENDMGKHGISSWLFGGCEVPLWGPMPRDYHFHNRIHVVRHPLKVVSSILACVPDGVQEYMARECGIDPEIDKMRRMILVYLRWHERILIRKPNMRVQVEHAPEHFINWLGRKYYDDKKLPPNDVNNRCNQLRAESSPPDKTWADFNKAVPPGDMIDFRALVEEYGYSL